MIQGKPLSQRELKKLLGEVLPSSVSIESNKESNSASHPATANDSSKVVGHEVNNTHDLKDKEGETINNEMRDSDYAGDYEELTESRLEETYRCLNFQHPAQLAAFYSKHINAAVDGVSLHAWQVEVSEQFGAVKPTQQHPHKFCLCACNGSGKDAFVIAPFVAWFALTKIKSRCIITSSSGAQLSSQTESYIKAICQSINEFHGEEIFRIRQRYIRCQLSGSEIRLFATDEEGKAEGYHPMEPNTEMAIIINEAKSVAPEIFRALRRCTGYNYWIEVSTPGAPHGDFFKHFSRWQHKRHVSTFDCPHLSAEEREEDKAEFGEHSSIYRSKHLALFTSEEGETVIPVELVDRCREFSKRGLIRRQHPEWPDRVGIDLAAGGAENTIVITKGNCIRKKLYFRERDTIITAQRINQFLLDALISKESENIFADDGGIGRAIIDMLVNMGWRIARQNNQSAASDKKAYSNKGAQNWFRAKRLIESNIWLFDPALDDDSYTNETNGLYAQLSNRYYKQQETQGKIALESKGEAIANGRPSPDRADAFVLSLTGLSVSDFTGTADDETKDNAKQLKYRKGFKTTDEIVAWHEEEVYKQYAGAPMNGDGAGFDGKSHGSLNSLLNKMRPKMVPKQFSNN